MNSNILVPIKFLILASTFIFTSIYVYGQSDSTQTSSEIKNKKGWVIGPFPAVGYNTDLGFQYGIYSDIYNFGDGSIYPGYFHKFTIEISRYTKGSGTLYFFYNTPTLWKNHKISIDIAWLPDEMYDFYGFNGYKSPYRSEMNHSFYKIYRNQIRVFANLQGKIKGNWNWYAGIAWQKMGISPVKLKKYENADNLYTHYINDGLIAPDEAKGGNILQFLGGIVYDSRDIPMDPTRGIYGEAIVSYAPDIIDRKGYSFMKTKLKMCYFQPILNRNITLAMHVGAQVTPLGKQPFYSVASINTSYLYQTQSEGLGGVASLRGIFRNRVIGNGMAWFNAEIRFRSPEFRFIKQNWYIAVNPFIDGGAVIQPYRQKAHNASLSSYILSTDNEQLHMSAGIGAKVVMNQNFVLSAEYGMAFDKRDGDNALFLGVNYLF